MGLRVASITQAIILQINKLIRASVQHFIVLIIQVQGLLLSDEEQALKDYAHQIVISIGQAQSAIAWFNLWQGYFYILRSSS